MNLPKKMCVSEKKLVKNFNRPDKKTLDLI